MALAARADLHRVMMGVASFDHLAQEGKARFDGDRTVVAKLRDLMVTFKPDVSTLIHAELVDVEQAFHAFTAVGGTAGLRQRRARRAQLVRCI